MSLNKDRYCLKLFNIVDLECLDWIHFLFKSFKFISKPNYFIKEQWNLICDSRKVIVCFSIRTSITYKNITKFFYQDVSKGTIIGELA